MTDLAEAQAKQSATALAEASQQDPYVLLLYEIMRRGSMLEHTIQSIIARINAKQIGPPTNAREQEHLSNAVELARGLWWSA